MAAKLLEKRFGIKDVSFSSCIVQKQVYLNVSFSSKVKEWLKVNDADNDGRLSYMEFKKSLKNFLNINDEANTKENGVENGK